MSIENITQRLSHWQNHGPGRGADVRDGLLRELYPELSRLAGRALRGQPPHATLDAGDVVNEAFIRLDQQRRKEWRNRAHFFAIAARVIRRVVLDHSRRRLSRKRGGREPHVSPEDARLVAPEGYPRWAALDQALERLARINPTAFAVVDLRYLQGLSLEETARALAVGTATVGRHWRFARAWLRTQLSPEFESELESGEAASGQS
ncbi:MAG: ECF-type sigma factor [Pseudomonadota bacterium]